jgi:hypothetical protein
MGFSDRMSNIAKKWHERRAEINPSLYPEEQKQKSDMKKRITEGENVGVSRTAEVEKKPAKKESAKSTPVKVTKKEVTVETPASDLGNIGSVDRTNPEVIGADMGFTKPAPVEERSYNAPARPASDNSRFSTSNPMGMKRGGSVKSSASSRGDGIAQRGKTKGRMR